MLEPWRVVVGRVLNSSFAINFALWLDNIHFVVSVHGRVIFNKLIHLSELVLILLGDLSFHSPVCLRLSFESIEFNRLDVGSGLPLLRCSHLMPVRPAGISVCLFQNTFRLFQFWLLFVQAGANLLNLFLII